MSDLSSSRSILARWMPAGPEFEVTEFLDRHDLPDAHVWHKGDPLSLGKSRTSSGFSLDIAEADSDATIFPLVCEFLMYHSAEVAELRRLRVNNRVSLLFGLGETIGYARVLSVPPGDMKLFGRNSPGAPA